MARLQRWIPHDQRPKKATPSSDHAKKSAAPKPRPSAADRFWRKVDKGEPDECWLCSYTPSKRYGQLTIDGQIQAAHRFAWELHNGPIPDGMHVRHRCDVPRCCNPAHLELGTHADNMRDVVKRGRHGRLVLSPDQVREIRQTEGTVRDLAARFGVSKSQISNIRAGRQQTVIE